MCCAQRFRVEHLAREKGTYKENLEIKQEGKNNIFK